MKAASPRSRRTRRSLEPVAWGALPVLSLAVGVFASGVGIDLLLLAVGCLFLLTLDRTVGDWMAETMGSGLGTATFALVVIAFTWYFLSYPSDDFFAAAEERGYRTAYYQRTSTADTPAESAAVRGSGGAHVQSGVAPSSGGTTQPGTPAVRNPEPQEKAEARLTVDSAPKPTRDAERTKSAEAPTPEGRPGRALGVANAASTRIFGTPVTAPAIPSRIVLTVSPAQVSAARRARLEVLVTAGGLPLTGGQVDFTVNGNGAGRVALDAHGIATTTFATYFAGTYEVRARYLGTTRYEPSSSAVKTLRVTQ